jgi:hypothetical protein
VSIINRNQLKACPALLLLFALGFTAEPASAVTDEPQKLPQALPAAASANKSYLSWNPMDLIMSGRLSIGVERIFRIGQRYCGLYLQYTSPMNYVFNGLVTGHDSSVSLSDEFQFPSTLDVYFCYYGMGRARTMRYYPRIGISRICNPGETERGTYLAFGPCGRVAFGKNFHVTFALTTLKIKLWGNRNYNWLQLPLFDFMVGIDF